MISDYKTKTEIIPKKSPRINGNNQYRAKTVIALDAGYSSVKGISPNRMFMFPSFAKEAPEALEVFSADKYDIVLKDNKTGKTYIVGKTAENLMTEMDVDSITDASLYTRYRYDSEIFKVIIKTGLALGLIGTPETDEIFLQTGLPATYKERDEEKLKKAFIGDYDLSIKVGNNKFYDVKFSLDEDHINVMEQPQGTLCGTVYSGGEVTEEGKKILTSKGTLILDVGFGTEDIFAIRAGFKANHQTYSDTGMKSVFEMAVNELKKRADADLKVFELQQFLTTGIWEYFDPDSFTTKSIDFKDIVYNANIILTEKSIKRLMQEYNNLIGFEYLIVTGGTGESRFNHIKSMLSGMNQIKVLPGNLHNPELSFAYSNVYGYYMFRHANLMAQFGQTS